MLDHLLAVEGSGSWFAVEIVIRATLLVALTAGSMLLVRRSAAALRHRIWALLFVALLLLPAVIAFASGFTWQVIPRSWKVEPTTAEAAVASSTFRVWLIWPCGTLLALVPLISGLLSNLRLRLQSARLDDSGWQQLLTSLSNSLDLQRNVTLLLGGSQQMPMTFGLWKPCVVLPADALQWSEERKRIVLLHELAHVNRYDVPLQMIGLPMCNPIEIVKLPPA